MTSSNFEYKTKEPLKVLSLSGESSTKSLSVYNFTAPKRSLFRNHAAHFEFRSYGSARHQAN